MKRFTETRNVAVIAHVDHGKTTLVDAMLKQTNVFRDNQEEMKQERILDSNPLEQERGITILAKNAAIFYKDTKINIIDTPGHADFSGEVERTLSMADGALLIIDAQEGPMPQTRFVLKKAFDLGLKIIVVINKVDKELARIEYVKNKIDSLFLEMATDESQIEFSVLYAVAREGKVSLSAEIKAEDNVFPLLDAILKDIPAPEKTNDKTFKMLISSLDYDVHKGSILIGRIAQGTVSKGQKVVLAETDSRVFSIDSVMLLEGLDRVDVDKASSGDVVLLSGVDSARIGQTLTDPSEASSIPSQPIGEPTLHIMMGPNTSPFAGREGNFVTSRQIEERLTRELKTNLSLRMKKTESGKYRISGRGELHLAVLLETMRREGYEMEVGKPEVITKKIDGVLSEPIEELSIVVPTEYQGVVTQELGKRLAKMLKMEPVSEKEVEFLYSIPTRSIIGLRSILLTQTKGTMLFSSQVIGYEPVGKSLPKFRSGALIAAQNGQALGYGLHAAQTRGIVFVSPGIQVYEGMIVGQNAKEQDIEINVCKGKKLTNMRSKSSDGILHLTPPTVFSLEQSLDFLEADELLEITPLSLRLRKKYLSDIERRRNRRQTRHDAA